jgi:hypothetical protein
MNTRAAFLSMCALAAPSPCLASVEISTDATSNMSCTGGVCSPTAKKAVLNVNDLTNMLATGDVKIVTGSETPDIQVKAPFSWTSTSRLMLDAMQSIGISQPVTVAGKGGLTVMTNDGGTGGTFAFAGKGSVSFWDLGSKLIVNTIGYTLVNDMATLARNLASNPDGDFALASSIEARHYRTRGKPVAGTFSGRLEGLGHAISHVSIDDKATVSQDGFFGSLTGTSVVENLRLVHLKIATASTQNAGGLAGLAEGTIFRVSIGGEIDAPGAFAGGVAGELSGTASNIVSAATVNGGEAAGGLLGESFGDILASHSSGAVSATNGNIAGGLVGLDYRVVDASSSTGPVTVGGVGFAGGLVGWLESGSTTTRSFATGAVSADGGVGGGFVGVTNINAGSGYLYDNYATGAISALVGGGFEGHSQSDSFDLNFSQAYSTGAVSGGGDSVLGGFIGYDDSPGLMTDAYWDFDTSGISDPSQGAGSPPNDPGITGLTDAQLKSGLPAGFDPAIWGQKASINNGYPYLLANPPPQ